MKILFLGGTGRLSKDVAELSLRLGNEVFLFTRGSSMRRIFVNDGYHMIIGDIRNVKESEKKLEGKFFDVVIDFISFKEKQLKNTLKIIEGKYKQYIFISSATVYNFKENEIISEANTLLGNKKWEYAFDKYLCELFLKDYFLLKEEKYTIIRPYVTYGNTRVPYPLVPRKSTFEYSFIERIEKGRSIPTFNNGETITTLTHTKDFAKGVAGLFGNEKAYGEEVHITNDNTVTWMDVLDELETALHIKINRIDFEIDTIIKALPEYRSVLKGDKARNTRFDNSKIVHMVPNYKCEISLESGIKDMVSFYEKHTDMQKIDYMWNGCMDRLCKVKGEAKKYLFKTKKDKIMYYIGYVRCLNLLYFFLKTIVNKLA